MKMMMMMGKQRGMKNAGDGELSTRGPCLGKGNFTGDGESWTRGLCLGKGSFGSVYLATTKKSKTKLNSFPPQMAVKSAEYSASSTLQRERKILRKLKDFRHVIRCFGEESTDGGRVYNLLLEYASGGSLYDLIFKKTRCFGLPESDVRRYTRSILQGIKHVHDCGYAHLDIKPDNILLLPAEDSTSYTSTTTTYEAKVCDFGLAKKVKQRKNKKRHSDDLRGTRGYMSPEAVAEGIQGPPCDIWGLGCVVLEMLTGMRVQALSGIIPMIPPDLSEEAKEFLRSCFSMKVEDRLTAGKLLELPFVSLPNETSTPDKETMINGFSRLLRMFIPLIMGRINWEDDYVPLFGQASYVPSCEHDFRRVSIRHSPFAL